MRKFCLMLAATAAVFATSALPTRADGLLPGAFERPIVDVTYRHKPHHARMVCTHFWGGRWHRREVCYWVPRHREHHWRH